MPFTPQTKNPGDLVKSDDWNALGQAIVELFVKFDQVKGHKHTGEAEDAPQIQQNGIASGVIPGNIGIAVTISLTNGTSIPIPTGFKKEECVFLTFVKAILNENIRTFNCYADDGAVVLTFNGPGGTEIPPPPNQFAPAYATGVAIAKKGGW